MPPRLKGRRPAKVEKVMHEYKRGTLHSSSGQKVTRRKQAVAIAMSEAGLARKKRG
jgi:cytochrome c553